MPARLAGEANRACYTALDTQATIMRAWRFYGFGDMRLEEVPDPQPRPRHVVVEILCVQPSVTEAQLAFGVPTLAYAEIKRRLQAEAPVQLFGHEFCARVLESPRGSRFRPGMRVAARAKLPCEECPLCINGRADECRKGPIIGFQLPGCFSELAVLPEIALVEVESGISDREGACLQSLSDSVAAVDTADIQLGDTVAVFGQGSMGLECMQAARTAGAGRILTVDVRDEACLVSEQLGADSAINATSRDPVEEIRNATGGNGADVVFECAGGSPRQGLAGSSTLGQAIQAVRSGGKLVVVSWFGAPLEIDVDGLRERSLRLIFPDISSLAHLEHTVRLVASGRIRLGPMLTHFLHGIESVREAFEITANKAKYGAINPAQVSMAASGERPRADRPE